MKYADLDIPLPLFRGAPPPPNRKNDPEPEFVPITQQAPPPPPPPVEEPVSTAPVAAAVPTPPPASPMKGPGGGAPPMGPFSTTEIERENYKMIFYQQDMDRDGFITGGDGVQFFRLSGLPDAILGQIWNLADIDQDGRLDMAEFIVAMHLICCATQRGLPVPQVLPPELIPPSKANVANPVSQSLNKTIDEFATGLVRSRSASRADIGMTGSTPPPPVPTQAAVMGGMVPPPPPAPMPSNTMVGASGNLGVDIAQQALATQTQTAMALGNIAEGLQCNKNKYDQQLQLIEKRLAEQQKTIGQYVEKIQSLQLELYDLRETYRKKSDEVLQNQHIITECSILLSGLSQERQQNNLEDEKLKVMKDRIEFTKTMLSYAIDDKGLIPPNPLDYAPLDSIPRPPPAGTPLVPSMQPGAGKPTQSTPHRAAPPPPPPPQHAAAVPAPPEFAPFPGSEPAADGFAPFPGSGSPVQEAGFAAFPTDTPAAPDAGGFAAFPTDDGGTDAGFAAFPTDDAAGGGFEAFPTETTAAKVVAPPPPPPPGRAPPPPPPKSPPKSPSKEAADAGFGAFPADDAAGGDAGFGAFPADDAAGGDAGFGAFPADDGGDGGFGAFPADGGDDGGFGAFPS